MRAEASILHLDLDAFFASVEQRDKPSLRGKPVVVGGTGLRGVVSTASYEARAFGARSAMPVSQARRCCPPGTAFLAGRFAAYRLTSAVVMDLLRTLSPQVEQVSVDEAYVDLAAGPAPDLRPAAVRALVSDLLAQITTATGGLTASAGVASSKMLAKIGSELDKPEGLVFIEPGQEEQLLAPLSVQVLGGVGPATAERLRTFGVETVTQLRGLALVDLVSIFGESHGRGLFQAARAQDDRPVVSEREVKSISAEETFARDVTDRAQLQRELMRMSTSVAERLAKNATFARTVTIKVRHHDFSTYTRSATLAQPTGSARVISELAVRLLEAVDVSTGLRLLGAGVSGLVAHAQDELELSIQTPASAVVPEFDTTGSSPPQVVHEAPAAAPENLWRTGSDVRHEQWGPGWVWGSGRGRVSVRFEGPRTAPGPVRTFDRDDPALSPADPPDWRVEPE